MIMLMGWQNGMNRKKRDGQIHPKNGNNATTGLYMAFFLTPEVVFIVFKTLKVI